MGVSEFNYSGMATDSDVDVPVLAGQRLDIAFMVSGRSGQSDGLLQWMSESRGSCSTSKGSGFGRCSVQICRILLQQWQ